jgi:hypothetical protein
MNELNETAKEAILIALANAIALEDAEETLKTANVNLQESSRQITNMTGAELWHTDAGGGKYFWKDGDHASAYYPGPADAIRAFLDNKVQWK